MADAQLETVLRHVRRIAAPRPAAASDDDLLQSFLGCRDPEAFATLVRRHGPMVLHVCRRVLQHQQDAEDAFQATFLILARKAASVRKRAALASWLHGAAYRMALSLQRAAARRRTHEPRAGGTAPRDPVEELSWREVQEHLEEEIQRLPEKYRIVFVLCCQEGLSRAEAARRLELKEGTVSSRLDQARKRLRQRLAARGVALAAVLGALALATEAEAASVPTVLAAATVRAAAWPGKGAGEVSARVAALVEGGLRTLLLTRRAVGLALVLALGALAGMSAFVVRQVLAGAPAAVQSERAAEPGDKAPVSETAARADLHGDPLPEGAVARFGTVRFRHGSTVTGLAFAPDGKALLSASFDQSVRLWDAATGRELQRFSHRRLGSASALGMSADGKTLVVRDTNGALFLGEVTTGRLAPVAGAEFEPGIALSPDGKTLAVGVGGAVRLIDTASGKESGVWKGTDSKVRAAAFSADGKSLASGDENGLVLLRNVPAGTQLQRLDCQRAVTALTFSPDGKTVATNGGTERFAKLRLWSTATGTLLHELGDHFENVDTIAFSPDGKFVASSGSQGQAYLWETATGKQVWQQYAYAAVFAFSPDGATLATSGNDGTIHLREATTGKERGPLQDGHQGSIRTLGVAQDGTVVATGGGGERSVRIWDMHSSKELRRLDASSTWFVGALALSADGKRVATDKGVWDTGSGKFLSGKEGFRTAFAGQDYSIEALAFAPDGKVLAMATRDDSVGKDRMIRLWDPATAREIRHFGTQPVRALAYAPDNKTLAAGYDDGTVLLWDATTGREGHRLKGHRREINGLAFSADGSRLASSSFDGDVLLWDTATGKQVGQLVREGGVRVNVLAVAFAANGKSLASAEQPFTTAGGASITVWELSTGRVRRRLTGHQGDVNAVAFAGGSRYLVSGSTDSTALVWDLAAARPGLVEKEGLWADLLAEDAARAYEAICGLAREPAGIKFLRQQLPPARTADVRQVEKLLKSLDSDVFAEREKAHQELARLGEAAEPALRQALEDKPSAEVRRRLNELLEKVAAEEGLRTGRAVEALELAGTEEARRVLEELAEGAPGARRTREAKAARERLRGERLTLP